MTKSLTPKEGAVFLVPLAPSGHALGVLTRLNARGKAFGYFFGPRVERTGNVDLTRLDPSNAVLVILFGDHDLHTGRWPVIGFISQWNRNRWKIPRFTRPHDRPDKKYIVEYDDALEVRSETIVSNDFPGTHDLPHDSQFGSGVVEVKLSKLLANVETAKIDRAPADTLDHLKKPTPVAHYIYVPTIEAATRVSDDLTQRGFRTERRLGADGVNWLVLASHVIVPTESVLESIGSSIQSLVDEVGGEYDGWEADVHRPEH